MNENPYQSPTEPLAPAPGDLTRARIGMLMYCCAFLIGFFTLLLAAEYIYDLIVPGEFPDAFPPPPILVAFFFAVPSVITIALLWGGYRLRRKAPPLSNSPQESANPPTKTAD